MVALLAAACSLAAQDPAKPVPAPASQELPPGIRWKVDLPAPPAAPPLIAGERVFVSALPGLVIAYRLADKQELWRQTLNPEQPLAAEGDRLFVAAGEAVHAYNAADHSVAWRRPTGPLTAPLLVKDGWVIAATAARLFALRASDGAEIWSRDSGPQRQRAAISGDLLFVPLASGRVVARDLLSGDTRWETERLGGAPAEPLVVADRLYFGATNKRFYCLDADDGTIEWDQRVGAEIRGTAASDGERVFYVALDNLVRGLDRSSGSQVWQQGVPFRPFAGPAVIGSAVILAGPLTDVWFLNSLTGQRAPAKLSFPEVLTLAPAYGVYKDATVIAGISGGLSEAWKLWLASPAPEKAAPPK